jgi:glycosyltransferase involved in cell wall biosynthesis
MNPSLRVLRVADVTNNRSGGMSRTMHSTGDELIRRGHQVEYLFCEDLNVSCRPQFRRFQVPRRIVERVRQRMQGGRPIDVVEVHEPAAAAYAWNRAHLPPLVIFSYGLEDRSHRATLAYQQKKGLPITLKNRYSPLSVVWQAMYATRRAAHVICSNSEDVEHLVGRGVDRARLTRHHSGVEPEFLVAGAALAASAPRKGLLFLGSWLHRKGTLDLVPAASEALARHPEEHLTIAGCHAGPETILSEFPAAIRPRIRVLPRIDGNQALIDIYRSHSVFVLPSYFEGQPLVMIEAAAMGLAIVTTPICGMRDFIVADQNGVTVPVGEPSALAAALDRLLTDPSLARRLGRAAQAQAGTHTWTTAADKIEAAYQAAAGLR